ncbi:MAG: hypothetical protein Q9220_005207 [cf. Caloplaca sp. 1 TL-2023]
MAAMHYIEAVSRSNFTHDLLQWTWIFIPLYLLYRVWVYPFYLSPLRKVPTVPGFPLWGHIFELFAHEAGVPQQSWHRNHGPIVRFFWPFGIERLSVTDSDAIKQMTIKNPYNYPYPTQAKRILRGILGNGILMAQGEAHIFQRRALASSFSTASVKALSPVFWQKGLLLTKLWQRDFDSTSTRRRVMDVYGWMNKVTLDIIGEAGFGYNIDSLRDNDAPFQVAYRTVNSGDFQFFQLLRPFITSLKYLPLKVNQDLKSSQQLMRNEATRVIEQKRREATGDWEKKTTSKDLIASIIKRDEEQGIPGQRITNQSLRDQVRTFMAAGHDTSSTTMCWILLHLAKAPKVQQKLRAEIKEHMPAMFDRTKRDQLAEEDSMDVDQLPYLSKVVRESLRCAPPIPMTGRQLLSPEHLAGYLIPAGTVVLIPFTAVNRSPEFWGDDSEDFNPDRWDQLPLPSSDSAGGNHGGFLTFSQGPKGCIARKFAETEIKVLLCCLLSGFSFGLDERIGDPGEGKIWKVVLRPKDGVRMDVEAVM